MSQPLFCQMRGHKIRVLLARYIRFIRRVLFVRGHPVRVVQVVFPGSKKESFKPANLQLVEDAFPKGPDELRGKLLDSYLRIWENELKLDFNFSVYPKWMYAEIDKFYEQERELIAELFLELA